MRESTVGKMPNKIKDKPCKLTHGHYRSMGEPPTCEDCIEDTPLTIKHILTECPHLTIEDTNSLALLTKL